MVRDVSNEDIKTSNFSMRDNKSLGPDMYTDVFFKGAWDIVGIDVINVVREFFCNGKLLKEVNQTIIALIPKLVFSWMTLMSFRVFREGNILVKYLGVPFISTRLVYKECKELVEKGEMRRGKAKVSWESVGLPKYKDGLGILWFDNWCPLSPSSYILTVRDITREGLHLTNKVVDMVSNNAWSWPIEWASKFPMFNNSYVHSLDANKSDILFWRNMHGLEKRFSQERNARLFKKMKRTQEYVIDAILSNVQLKLLILHFKRSIIVESAIDAWNLPPSLTHGNANST
ncbi:hypothetical protein Tco_0481614 [Tanacetum coccineum]